MKSKIDFTSSIQDALNGNEEAFRLLYEVSAPYFISEIRKYDSSQENQEDILQNVYIRVFTNLSSLENPELFLAWGRTICRNESIRYGKKANRIRENETPHPAVSEEEEEGIDVLPASAYDKDINPEVKLDADSSNELIYEVLDTLTPFQRSCIMLWMDQLTQKEIAEELGTTTNTVKSTLHYAMKKMKPKLIEIEKRLGTTLFAPLTFFIWLFHCSESECAVIIPAAVSDTIFAGIIGHLPEDMIPGKTAVSSSAVQGTSTSGDIQNAVSSKASQGAVQKKGRKLKNSPKGNGAASSVGKTAIKTVVNSASKVLVTRAAVVAVVVTGSVSVAVSQSPGLRSVLRSIPSSIETSLQNVKEESADKNDSEGITNSAKNDDTLSDDAQDHALIDEALIASMEDSDPLTANKQEGSILSDELLSDDISSENDMSANNDDGTTSYTASKTSANKTSTNRKDDTNSNSSSSKTTNKKTASKTTDTVKDTSSNNSLNDTQNNETTGNQKPGSIKDFFDKLLEEIEKYFPTPDPGNIPDQNPDYPVEGDDSEEKEDTEDSQKDGDSKDVDHPETPEENDTPNDDEETDNPLEDEDKPQEDDNSGNEGDEDNPQEDKDSKDEEENENLQEEEGSKNGEEKNNPQEDEDSKDEEKNDSPQEDESSEDEEEKNNPETDNAPEDNGNSGFLEEENNSEDNGGNDGNSDITEDHNDSEKDEENSNPEDDHKEDKPHHNHKEESRQHKN